MMRTLLIVVLSVAAALLGLTVVYHFVPEPGRVAGLDQANDVVGGYLQTVGTVYAVLLAFVVFVVWSQHNEASGHIHRESNDLLDLYRVLRGFPEPCRCYALDKVRDYTDAILQEEWDDMQHGRECGRARVYLEQLWLALEKFEPTTSRQEVLYGEALSHFNDLSDTRAERLRSARTRIPSILWLVLLSGAVVVVASMYLFTLRSFATHAFMTGALAGAISHVLYVIYDLDICFSGYFQVSRAPFQRVREHMDHTPVAGPATPA